MKSVKLTKLQNPKRVYFDINSAVLGGQQQNWFLNSGGVKQVRVSQFSTTPAVVRVVLYLDEDFDQSKISFMKVNNNIVIKFREGIGKVGYFQNTYRDERASSSDFYENLSISSDEQEKIKTVSKSVEADVILNQIQQSFNTTAHEKSAIKEISSKTAESLKKELKLNSKYFLNSISPKGNGFLVSGFGVVGIEKPMYLTNPARVVFDIPNAISNPDIRNKDFKVGEDTIKIGQFLPNKIRIVVTSSSLEKYYPIFSSDGQSILFMNTENFDSTKLFDRPADAVSYYHKKIDSLTNEFIIAFNSPILHSVRRDGSKLTIDFYNTLRYNDLNFKNSIKNTDLSNMKIDLLEKVGIKLSLPLEKDSVVNCFLGADGKSVKIVVKGVVKRIDVCAVPSAKNIVLPRCNGKKVVVIDAGHGGADYGAIRSGINEKDINLDIAKKLQSLLESKGVIVHMTREKDETLSLEERTTFSATKSPDIFVSIHVNSSVKPDINGIETHYFHQESLELAQILHSSMVSGITAKDRGLFKSRFYVINHTDVPAVLLEVGFISNEEERADLVSEDRKQQSSKAIAEGILKYLNKK